MKLLAVAINGLLDLKNFYPLALALKAKHGIDMDIMAYAPDLQDLAPRYNGLVVGSDWNQNAALVQHFNAKKKKTILCQSEGLFVDPDQWYIGKAPITRAACLWGPVHEEIFRARGYTGNTVVCGPPRFDLYWRFRPTVSKRDIYKAFGMEDKGRPYIVVLCQHFPAQEFGEDLHQTQVDLMRLAPNLMPKGYVIVKAHPQEPAADFAARRALLGATLPAHLRIADSGAHSEQVDISSLISYADGVVTFSSTAALEAMMLGRPAAIHAGGSSSPLANGAIASLPVFTDQDSLSAILASGSHESTYRDFVQKFLPGAIDGKYAETAARFIAGVVSRK